MAAESTRSTLLLRVRDTEDEGAWREFDDRYRELILRYGRARGLQEADAEDVRQTVMVGLSRSLRRFEYRRGQGRFRDYLRRVTTNAVNTAVSHPSASPKLLSMEELEQGDHSDEDRDATWDREWMHHHFRVALRRARKAFEPRSIAVFEDLLAGRSVKHVADEHGISPDAVYKVKFRLRDHLEQLIAEQLQDEDS
jgi:RNA polymerase sigma-70 factor (ECF subfamily)